MSSELTQKQADTLLSMQKKKKDDASHPLPDLGGKITVELTSMDEREEFQLDVVRGRINLERVTYQNRARKTVVLARLDVDGRPHRNPDHTEIGVPHLHIYKEGYADKWAYEVPTTSFENLEDRWQTLLDFMTFCNIVEQPFFDKSLFS